MYIHIHIHVHIHIHIYVYMSFPIRLWEHVHKGQARQGQGDICTKGLPKSVTDAFA